jgi:hypothetical protein
MPKGMIQPQFKDFMRDLKSEDGDAVIQKFVE